jgi:hypothetical protein
MTLDLKSLSDGIAFWHSRPKWPNDFHNNDYRKLAIENPNGEFTREWWDVFLPRLQAWIAIRPFSYAQLTDGFSRNAEALGTAWKVACEPHVADDISSITWDEVRDFPTLVGKVKPTLAPSPVFISKFCHFLMPRIFPVVDNEGMGNRWQTYGDYFKLVQKEWAFIPPDYQMELVDELTRLVEAEGQAVFEGFPMKVKIVELCLIGQQHLS